jgi:hypothetical protein
MPYWGAKKDYPRRTLGGRGAKNAGTLSDAIQRNYGFSAARDSRTCTERYAESKFFKPIFIGGRPKKIS